jgi:beta propeller repeat protein
LRIVVVYLNKTHIEGRPNMRRQVLFIGIAVILGSLDLEVKGDLFPICTDVLDQYSPAISGNIVVWTSIEGDHESYDIYGYDLRTQEQFPICVLPGYQAQPAVSGNIVVWVDRRSGHDEIYGYNLNTASEFVICSDSANKNFVAINCNIVVWADERNGNEDIYAYNLSTQTEFPICTEVGSQSYPDVSGNIVVWSDYRNNDNFDIYGYDISTTQEFAICINERWQLHPHISGDVVVWQDDRDYLHDAIYGYSLAMQTEFPLATDVNVVYNHPAINGNCVVWRSGTSSIYWHNLSTQETSLIHPSASTPDYPVTNGQIVVWCEIDAPDDKNIYGYDFAGCSQNIIDVPEGVPYHGSTTNSIATADESSCGYNDTRDVWHWFIPQMTGRYTISLCGSDFDTTLAVFDDCDGTEIECNDDFCDLQSELTVKVKVGQEYYIRVAGYDGATGDYTLLITEPECINRPRSDINGDCCVNFQDLAILLSEWLNCGWEQ